MVESMTDDTTITAEPLVRIGDVAKATGLPVRFIRRMSDEGLLPVFRTGEGRHRRFPIYRVVRRAREVMNGGCTDS